MEMKALRTVVVVFFVLSSGCTHVRYASVPNVLDTGQPLRTENCYKLVEYSKLGNKQGDSRMLWSTMEHEYPGVFRSDGIPFSLQETGYKNIELSGIWTFFFPYLCSCGILPMLLHNEHTATVEVKVDGNHNAIANFDIRYMKDTAFTCYSPFALFCYGGRPSTQPLQKVYWGSTTSENNTWLKNKTESKALAFATAVKLKEVESSGGINKRNLDVQTPVTHAKKTPHLPIRQSAPKKVRHEQKTLYDVVSIERKMDGDFSYRFELKLMENVEWSLNTLKTIKYDFRKNIKDDYSESFVGSSVASLFVEFSSFFFRDGTITGRAVVMNMIVKSMNYDPLSRTGHLSVLVNANQFEETRKWIRKNIETLARDKNIALVTGEIPPAAKFYLGREELKDGNVLEIEFKTE